jgi:hypothetical protein
MGISLRFFPFTIFLPWNDFIQPSLVHFKHILHLQVRVSVACNFHSVQSPSKFINKNICCSLKVYMNNVCNLWVNFSNLHFGSDHSWALAVNYLACLTSVNIFVLQPSLWQQFQRRWKQRLPRERRDRSVNAYLVFTEIVFTNAIHPSWLFLMSIGCSFQLKIEVTTLSKAKDSPSIRFVISFWVLFLTTSFTRPFCGNSFCW